MMYRLTNDDKRGPVRVAHAEHAAREAVKAAGRGRTIKLEVVGYDAANAVARVLATSDEASTMTLVVYGACTAEAQDLDDDRRDEARRQAGDK